LDNNNELQKEIKQLKDSKDFWIRNYQTLEEKLYKLDEINTRLVAENSRLKEMLENRREMYEKVVDENETLRGE
jgi:hypothetical protein